MAEEVGEILLGDRRISFAVVRSKRRRRTIAFEMKNSSALKITAPVRASLSSIRSVIQKQTGWIKRRLAELQRLVETTKLSPPKNFNDGDTITYLGCTYLLRVTQDTNRPQGCTLRPHLLSVNLHMDNLSVKDRQQEVRLEILLWLKRRSKVKFLKRMDYFSYRLGVRYQKLIVANPERRWGSCNAQNVIRLNWRLIMAPLPILDYVVVHELCHVRHKNHGPNFWRQVASIIPEYKNRRKHLRFIGTGFVL